MKLSAGAISAASRRELPLRFWPLRGRPSPRRISALPLVPVASPSPIRCPCLPPMGKRRPRAGGTRRPHGPTPRAPSRPPPPRRRVRRPPRAPRKWRAGGAQSGRHFRPAAAARPAGSDSTACETATGSTREPPAAEMRKDQKPVLLLEPGRRGKLR
ncbi:proline-rich protein 2-like [Choloepus didactylus]|uniref:proline-rich protein 2-like n=1 Tax=Choloepus didactylus TaxID=27675 RepID=UPI0018A07257|nr:proline-rich protein 2-like [Choloepus didactylus]